jgi:hypothetical protein
MVEGVVMSILLLYVLQGYHLFHYGEAQAASFRFVFSLDRVRHYKGSAEPVYVSLAEVRPAITL